MSTIIHLDIILWVLSLNLEGETMKKIIPVTFVGRKSLTLSQLMMLIIITIMKQGVVMDTTVIMDMKGRPGMMDAMTILAVIIIIDPEITIITEMIAVEKIMIMLVGVMILIMKGAV